MEAQKAHDSPESTRRILARGKGQSMKKLLLVSATFLLLVMGCAPSGQVPAAGNATPTPADKITEMDFESGEVEQGVSDEVDQEEESPPDTE